MGIESTLSRREREIGDRVGIKFAIVGAKR